MFGLVGKLILAPLVPSQAIFLWARKMPNNAYVSLFSLVGQWALFTRFGPLSTRCGAISVAHQGWMAARAALLVFEGQEGKTLMNDVFQKRYPDEIH